MRRPGQTILVQKGRLVDRFLQSLACFELSLVRGRNLNLFAGTWVPALGSLAPCNAESAETHQPYFATTRQFFCDRVEHTVDSFRRVCF